MRAQPVDLIGGYYKDDSLPWSAQDTVNWLPVMAEVAGTRTVKKFSTPPGLKPWQQIGTGPIRGMHDCEGLRLVVSGRYLYRITPAGVGVPIGVIPGVGRVQMTHNQFKTGFQVLIENGQGGGGYVYTTSTDTFAKITDEGYPGSISSDYLDSYILGVEPQGRFWFHSNLADATDYNTLDRYEAEAAPDRIVGLAVSASEVVVFGQRTTEFYINSGAATGTFQNRKSSITRGCASRHTIQKLDNTLFWLGDDGVVYRLEGYLARPVSTRPLEKAISGYNWPEAIACVWEDRGHKVYYLTFPDGQTFGYDVITGLWHRRQSFGMNRWRLSHIIPWGRDWYGGDVQNGRLWQLDWDYFLEGDQPIVSERVSPALSDDQSSLIVPNAELILDTGQGPGAIPVTFPAQPSIPKITNDAPSGDVGFAWAEFTYTVEGGTPPLSFKITSGQLPPGIGPLSAAGVIAAGTPTTAGEYRPTVRVTDANGMWDEIDDVINIGVPWYGVGVLGTTGRGRYAIGRGGGTDWANPVQLTGVGVSDEYGLVVSRGSQIIMIPASAESAAVSSDGGSSWATAALPVTNSRGCWAIDQDTVLIGCNDSVIMRSATGTVYTAVTVNTSGSGSFYGNFNGISSMNGRSVAVGDRASVSTDKGASWSPLQENYVVGNGVVMRCIANSGSIFLSAGDSNRMATSSTGTSWAEIPSPFTGSSPITVAAFTRGVWVLANSAGQIAYGASPGSMTLSAATVSGGATALYAARGRFVIGGANGALMTSTNGAIWEVLAEPFTGAVSNLSTSP